MEETLHLLSLPWLATRRCVRELLLRAIAASPEMVCLTNAFFLQIAAMDFDVQQGTPPHQIQLVPGGQLRHVVPEECVLAGASANCSRLLTCETYRAPRLTSACNGTGLVQGECAHSAYDWFHLRIAISQQCTQREDQSQATTPPVLITGSAASVRPVGARTRSGRWPQRSSESASIWHPNGDRAVNSLSLPVATRTGCANLTARLVRTRTERLSAFACCSRGWRLLLLLPSPREGRAARARGGARALLP